MNRSNVSRPRRGNKIQGLLGDLLDRITLILVFEAMAETNGNRSDAARLLGVDKAFVSRHLRVENARALRESIAEPEW